MRSAAVCAAFTKVSEHVAALLDRAGAEGKVVVRISAITRGRLTARAPSFRHSFRHDKISDKIDQGDGNDGQTTTMRLLQEGIHAEEARSPAEILLRGASASAICPLIPALTTTPFPFWLA